MSSITLFYNGTPLVRQSIRQSRIRIGAAGDNDLVLEANGARESRLTIERDLDGRWRSSLEAPDRSVSSRVVASGKRFELGAYAVRFEGEKEPASDVDGDGDDMGFVGQTDIVRALRERIRLLAPLGGSVLVEGESGSGKELVARAVHARSRFNDGPFVPVNCGALGASMVEDIFFGHERGAFTGAGDTHRGVFEQANGGTLFLDEIGELPPLQQAALLRVLDNGCVSRIGSERGIQVRFRLVAATNRSLLEMVESGQFRLDLYHRIGTLGIRTPSLRQRPEDIPLLARAFLLEMEREMGHKTLSQGALACLTGHRFPGNCRELKNVLYKAAALCGSDVLRECDLELQRTDGGDRGGVTDGAVVAAMVRCNGNISAAARRLGVPRTTLRNRLPSIASQELSELSRTRREGRSPSSWSAGTCG